MTKITSAEPQESFGRYLTEAHNQPAMIINHGNDDLVLISAEKYASLRQLDQQAFYAHELGTEVLNEM